jgi:hypothetical protein
LGDLGPLYMQPRNKKLYMQPSVSTGTPA